MRHLVIPPRLAPIAFALIMSFMMSCVISGVSTVRAVGFVDGVLSQWMGAWMFSWMVAFPFVAVVAPFSRKIVGRMTRAA